MSRTSRARILSLILGSVLLLLLLVAGDAAIADHSSCVALVLLRKVGCAQKRSTGVGEADARAERDPWPHLTNLDPDAHTVTVAGWGPSPAFRLRSPL
jgi:hypothetical protein